MSSSAGNQYDGPLTIINNATHEVYLSSADTSYFSDIVLSNTSTGGIVFGNTGGVSYLASGKTIAIGSSGFTNNYLTLKNFYQQGSTAQTITLTGTAILNLINANFEGNLTVTTPGILLKNSTFNGTTSITRNGTSGSFHCDGGNTFAGALVLDNAGSSGRVRMANTTPDTYLGNVTFNSTGGQDVQLCYTGNSYFYGNITINSSKVVFNTSNGKVTFAGGNAQTLNGSYNFPFKKLSINKSANHVTANTMLSVDDSLIFVSGNLITTSSYLLTMKHGSTANGASNSSFVSGPVKKVGNSAFQFPVGEGNAYLPISISAPSQISYAYTAQMYFSRQLLGNDKDVNLDYLSEYNHWYLERNVGNSKVKVKLHWDNRFSPVIDTARLRLAHRENDAWEELTNGIITGNYSQGSLSSVDSIDSFGYFIFAYTKNNDELANRGIGFIRNDGQLINSDTIPVPEVLFYSTVGEMRQYYKNDTIRA